jgi:glutamate 5-kinase
VDVEDWEFVWGFVNYSWDEVEKIKGLKSLEIVVVLGHKLYDEVIHWDNLVLLEGTEATANER